MGVKSCWAGISPKLITFPVTHYICSHRDWNKKSPTLENVSLLKEFKECAKVVKFEVNEYQL